MLVIYPSSYASFKKFKFFVVFKLGQIFRVLHLRPYLKYPIFLSSLKCHINMVYKLLESSVLCTKWWIKLHFCIIGWIHQMIVTSISKPHHVHIWFIWIKFDLNQNPNKFVFMVVLSVMHMMNWIKSNSLLTSFIQTIKNWFSSQASQAAKVHPNSHIKHYCKLNHKISNSQIVWPPSSCQ